MAGTFVTLAPANTRFTSASRVTGTDLGAFGREVTTHTEGAHQQAPLCRIR